MLKLVDFGFLSIRLIDIVDIILVALLLYGMYKIVRGSIALNVFIGGIVIYTTWFIVRSMGFRLLSTILGQFIGVGAIAILIVFQQEIRRFLLLIGKNHTLFKSSNFKVTDIFPWNWNTVIADNINFDEISAACRRLSKGLVGVLIVVERSSSLRLYIETGNPVGGAVTAKMIETIFNKKSPLHDGAMIISDNKIQAASCILPVTSRPDIPVEFGLRHRSSIGITEETDAMVIIVSEQTGDVAVASRGKLYTQLPKEDLPTVLFNYYNELGIAKEVLNSDRALFRHSAAFVGMDE